MYCNIEDIKEAITQNELILLTDDNNNGFIDIEVVENAIIKSSEVIDGYLRATYKLPLTNQHEVLTIICVGLVKNILHKRRKVYNEQVANEYKETIQMLKEVGSKKILLAEPTEQSNATIVSPAKAPLFTKKLFDNFMK